MFTSLVDFMYDHCVFPLNQMVICGVVATNFVPFTDIVPDVLPTEPGLERAKRAVTPPWLATMAVALSRQDLFHRCDVLSVLFKIVMEVVTVGLSSPDRRHDAPSGLSALRVLST